MKQFNIYKLIPFLITLIIVFFFNINNQKQPTKLNILIWNTPTLSLGNYLAISSGAGFILSFLLTINLSKINQTNSKIEIKYNTDYQDDEPIISNEYNYGNQLENTLIERDLKDPSPTVNASFRVISKNKINKYSQINNQPKEYDIDDSSVDYQFEDYKQEINYTKDNENNLLLNDWEDDSYQNW